MESQQNLGKGRDEEKLDLVRFPSIEGNNIDDRRDIKRRERERESDPADARIRICRLEAVAIRPTWRAKIFRACTPSFPGRRESGLEPRKIEISIN